MEPVLDIKRAGVNKDGVVWVNFKSPLTEISDLLMKWRTLLQT